MKWRELLNATPKQFGLSLGHRVGNMDDVTISIHLLELDLAPFSSGDHVLYPDIDYAFEGCL